MDHIGELGPVDPVQVGVIGTGYVGLTVGACLAHLGHRVTCTDVDVEKVAALRQGRIPIVEDGLDTLVAEGLEQGTLSFELVHPEALGRCDVVFLCLPTPVRDNGDLDLSYVEQAVRHASGHLRPDCIVVTKSTVPVGTAARVRRWLGRADVHVASNPEFLREGCAVRDFLEPARVVIGATDERVAARLAALHAGLHTDVVVTDPASAEMIKYAANAFLATKISFINEIGRLCEAVGADVTEVAAGIGSDPRIGPEFLRTGPGWGGSCFPKDSRGLAYLAAVNDVSAPVVEASIRSNDDQLDHVYRTVRRLVGPADAVAMWGAAFKAGTDDCRESPALALADRLVAAGIEVRIHDPAARFAGRPGVIRVASAVEACDGVAGLVVMTEWPEYRDVDLQAVRSVMAGDVVCDARDVVDGERAVAAGLTVVRLGRPNAAEHAGAPVLA